MSEYVTPIVLSNNCINGNKLYIKREDLLPFSFGGNKARIAKEFYDDMDGKGANVMIGYGNSRSNLSRILANVNRARDGKCIIISPDDDDGTRTDTNNSRIVQLCDAEIVKCNKDKVALKVKEVIEQCRANGDNPYYIYGNELGKGNELTPLNAYIKVFREIKVQEAQMNTKFDYIFCATGTGMTQSGLIIGNLIEDEVTRIVGISVARDSEKEKKILLQNVLDYCEQNKLDISKKELESRIELEDRYICGGYGKYSVEIIQTIKEELLKDGMPLDTTYTGKAFWGMKEYLVNNNIQNKNILFIHTGGTPLFFDSLEKIKESE